MKVQLGGHAQDVEMDAIRQEEVPELDDFCQRRCAG